MIKLSDKLEAGTIDKIVADSSDMIRFGAGEDREINV